MKCRTRSTQLSWEPFFIRKLPRTLPNGYTQMKCTNFINYLFFFPCRENIKWILYIKCNIYSFFWSVLKVFKFVSDTSVETLYSVVSFIFRGETQHRALAYYQSEEIQIIILQPRRFYFFFSFMHTCILQVGSRVLRHSAPHFLQNFRAIACWVAEFNATLCFDSRAKKWKY